MPARIRSALKWCPEAPGLVVVHSETSAGCLQDAEAIGRISRPYDDFVLIGDSITGFGAGPCKTDAWHLDVVMTGSQKGLMLPPGLAALTVSEKAWRAYERSTLPKYYFDWMKYRKNLDKETTPFTPAVSLVVGLVEALRMMREEGLENLIARHAPPAEAINPHVTKTQIAAWDLLGRANAARFDERGWAYYVREVSDAFYPV